MPHLFLQLFGTIQATLDSKLITRFEYKKVRALLAYLVMQAGRPQEREHLTGIFWPDLPEQLARQNLSQALLNLREAIEDRRATPAYLTIQRETIQFNPLSDYAVDVEGFKTLLATCESHRHRRLLTCTACARRYQQAAEFYQGDFLAQFFINDSPAFDEWTLIQLEDLRQGALNAFQQLSGYFEWRRAYEQAIYYTRRQLELDPWREEAHRQLMRLFTLQGQRSAALVQFEKCRATLKEALGVEPESETRVLFEFIRDHSSGDSQILDQISLYQPPPSNLPARSTPLIGRQAETSAVRELLLSDEVRLVTLTGSAGIGKTSLGITVAANLRDDFEDGVFWFDLAPLAQSDLVVPKILQTLGVAENTGISQMAGLVQYLKGRQMLLVLDNFEQVLDAAPYVAEVLAACVDVKMLVTSRTALRVRAEKRFLVAPLAEEDAAALFVERARAILPAFPWNDDTSRLIRSICIQLDGLPLAIELIAARLDVLPLAELAAQLDRRLSFLTNGPRDLPLRQQTLRNAIDWSFALLSPDEQSLFARLGVFVGGCTLEAVAAVCDVPVLMPGRTETLAALVHKSLIQAKPGADRYSMLESIRQYALEKLAASGEIERFSRLHRDWCLSLAEAANREWREEQRIEALDRLEGEHDNLRAALTWSRANPQEAEGFLQLARQLWRFWDRRSHFSEGRRWLEAAIRGLRSTPEISGLSESLADALEGAGYLVWRLGDAPVAQKHLLKSLELYQALGRQLEAASVLNTLGLVAWGQADHDQARAYYAQSLDLYCQAKNEFGMARVFNNQGILDFEEGNYAAAQTAYEQSLAIMRQNDNPLVVAWILLNLGGVAHSTGDFIRARQYYEECLVIERQFGEKADIALTLTNLAELAYELGDYALARTLGEESLTLRREVEDKAGLVPSLIILGRVEQHDGHFTTAHERLIECLTVSRALGNALLTASTLEQMAKLACDRRKAAHAAWLFAKAEALREEAKTPRPPIERVDYERYIRAVMDQLGETIFPREWEHGRGLSFDQLVAVALDAN